jgi:methylmalonyl-CoA mutase
VICSTDERYPSLVPPLARSIRQKNDRAILVLAGYPEAQVEAHKAAGVDAFIHVRADVLETLSRIHTQMGVQS